MRKYHIKQHFCLFIVCITLCLIIFPAFASAEAVLSTGQESLTSTNGQKIENPPAEETTSVYATEIKLNKSSLKLEVQAEATITATLLPENTKREIIHWKTNNKKVATVSLGGVVTGVAEGTAKITAYTKSGIEKSILVTVVTYNISKVTLSKEKISGYVGETATLAATLSPSSTIYKSVSWSSSNRSIATVSKNGVVTFLKEGTATITATAKNGKKAVCIVTAKVRPIKQIALSSSNITGKRGEVVYLKASITPTNATYPDVKWKSSNTDIATVSSKGKVTLLQGGTAIITAYSEYDNKKQAECKVTVENQFVVKHYFQGDDAWHFSRETEKKACAICAFAMLLKSAGYSVTPRSVYNLSGKRTSPNYSKIAERYHFNYVCAVGKNASYLSGFDGCKTTIKNPSKNAVKAIKEALNRHPEGVMVYFRKGNSGHALLAMGYRGNEILYSDPGRVREKGHNVTLKNTWAYRGHKMGYSNLSYILAIDK